MIGIGDNLLNYNLIKTTLNCFCL